MYKPQPPPKPERSPPRIGSNRHGSADFSAKDERLALCLAKGMTRAAAAAECSMGVRTIYSKLADPSFRQLVNDRRSTMLDETFGCLVAAGNSAIAVIQNVMHDLDSPASIRLRAACEILDSMIKVGSYAELSERIAELERRCQT